MLHNQSMKNTLTTEQRQIINGDEARAYHDSLDDGEVLIAEQEDEMDEDKEQAGAFDEQVGPSRDGGRIASGFAEDEEENIEDAGPAGTRQAHDRLGVYPLQPEERVLNHD